MDMPFKWVVAISIFFASLHLLYSELREAESDDTPAKKESKTQKKNEKQNNKNDKVAYIFSQEDCQKINKTYCCRRPV